MLSIFQDVYDKHYYNVQHVQLYYKYIRVIPNFEKIRFPHLPWLGSKYKSKYKMSWIFLFFLCIQWAPHDYVSAQNAISNQPAPTDLGFDHVALIKYTK